VREIEDDRFDFERLIPEAEIYQLPLKRLLGTAAKNAAKKSECSDDYYFVLGLPGNEYAMLNARIGADPVLRFLPPGAGSVLPEPRSEVSIDPRYLFGLLSGVYHWNNAEVGSQYFTRRHPNRYHPAAQSFLNYLVV
jgi:hypothetical protein